ncbi:hypothetical protein L228DRAFT_283871 [Xylona heveae TC161]|uniref:Uncharacterized protein n=1 Tax=Xylona heveae (strain CBS 132557 / TC161) TaxID=1328760 RepID=A0A165G4V3_XYLHT|nr:hypothetical protein L228DRAFT_283871 [Xylona heveae TC161]KZF21741.1 hypothetical protein L228DRAFT_283871 [Xylona heveae TC161]
MSAEQPPISPLNQNAQEAVNNVPRIVLRAPSVHAGSHQAASLPAPPMDWLCGTWTVTHSTLPMWKSKRNVRITYTAVPAAAHSSNTQATDRLDDLVSYQSLSSTKVKTIHGIDKASGGAPAEGNAASWAWDWRGKGPLAIASSHWEILGWSGAETDDPRKQWAVTYFAKTLFTPAGIDIYCRSSEGVSPETLVELKDALDRIDDSEIKQLASSMFEVTRDGARDE